MSVSTGKKKIAYKSFHITLQMIDTFGNTQNPPQNLSGKKKIQPWTKLKQKISSAIGVGYKKIRLFYNNLELIDELTMLDYQIVENKKPIIFFSVKSKHSDFSIHVYGTFHCHLILQKIIEDVLHGFVQGLAPQLIQDGTSGTYRLRNVERETVAIFKPIDEEPFAPNNQKGYVNKFGSESFRKGILSGEGAIREYAAYALDERGFFDVPQTTFVELTHPAINFKNEGEMIEMDEDTLHRIRGSVIHNFLIENIVSSKVKPNKKSIYSDDEDYDAVKGGGKYKYITKKFGSLQKFVKSTDVAANFSFSLYTTDEVHKIAILDFRICNCDRNDENILVLKKKRPNGSFYKLVPIDHSLSLPDCIKIYDYELCWMGWDQAQEPFSEKMKEYINSIDIVGDMERLSKTIKLREDCWKMFRISNTVLKICTEHGLNLYEMGNLMYKLDYKNDSPSQIELLIEKTDKLCSSMKIDNRLKIFSDGNSEVGVIRERKRKMSLLKRSTSEPNLEMIKEEEKEEENKAEENKQLLNKENNKIKNEIVFNSPYNELYFHHFEAFLIELIKKKYPEKFLKKEEEKVVN